MMNARELAVRACEIGNTVEPRDERLKRLEALFQQHARDQRHLCAEAVAQHAAPVAARFVAGHVTMEHAHAAVMNAPAPGDG